MQYQCKNDGCTNTFHSSPVNRSRGFDKYCSVTCRDEAMGITV